MIQTVAEFLEALTLFKILQADQLNELATEVIPRFSDRDPQRLAKYLLQRNWLTVYQVNQLMQGNARELVLGPYRIQECLGEGAVSVVYKAWDTRRKCVACLKTIKTEHMNNVEAVGRFKREMQVISSMSHPNIVKAFDVDLDNQRHYFAMEYVEGIDLGKMVKLSGPLPVSKASEYIRQAALGLQHAHERGLVHRDIKPGNLLLTSGNVVKILDMGMARLRGSSGEDAMNRLTMEGMMIGTPDYLAPEQARDPRNVDIRADIYSLGCTFFYLLAGEPPFPGKTVIEKLFKHQQARPNLQSIESVEEGELAAIIEAMMAKKPDDRYQTPEEVAAVLAPYAEAAKA